MKNTFWLLILALISSCNTSTSNKKNTPKQIKVDVDDLKEEVYKADDIIEDYYFIKLETISNSNLIGNIDKILILEKYLIILDREITGKVYLFNRSGSFVRMIGERGEGPGEYKKPQDVIYNENAQHIVVYCRDQRKLIYYSEEGQLVAEKRIDLDFRSFITRNNKYACFTHQLYNYHPNHGSLTYNYIVFDTIGKIHATQFNSERKSLQSGIVITHNKYFNSFNKECFLNWIFNDTIYRIDENLKATPVIYFDFGNRSLTNNTLEISDDIEIYREVVMEGQYHTCYSPFLKNNISYIINISAGISNEYRSGIHTLLSSSDFSRKVLFKDIEFNDNSKYSFPIASHGDYYVSVLYPDEMYLDSGFDNRSKISLKGIETEIGEFDNPILMFTRFKFLENEI